MSAHPSLIPELDEVIQRGSPARRVTTLQRITALFLDGANRFNDAQVQLFDMVFGRLIAEIEVSARTELSRRLAPLDNAPLAVVRRLAQDDDIAVAGPVLAQSRRLVETELVHIAASKSQAHLAAVAARSRIAEPVTDLLVRRGDRKVAHRLVENHSARLSRSGLIALIGRAEKDDALAKKIARRPDLRPRLLRGLLHSSWGAVRQHLSASAAPATPAEITHAPARVSDTGSAAWDSAAQRVIETLRLEGRLNESALVDFARHGRYGETVAALASLCSVPIEVAHRLMAAERPDPVLILCKSAGWRWPTAHAVITAQPGGRKMSQQSCEAACADFERLSPATALRVLRFWQASSHGSGQRREDDLEDELPAH